jgi:hypothetical protein
MGTDHHAGIVVQRSVHGTAAAYAPYLHKLLKLVVAHKLVADFAELQGKIFRDSVAVG